MAATILLASPFASPHSRSLEAIASELRQVQADAGALDMPLDVVMPEVRCRMNEWQRILADEPMQARGMLRTLLKGRLVFTPDLERHAADYLGQGNLSEVFRGLINVPKALASPMTGSWNQIASWLRQVESLRQAA